MFFLIFISLSGKKIQDIFVILWNISRLQFWLNTSCCITALFVSYQVLSYWLICCWSSWCRLPLLWVTVESSTLCVQIMIRITAGLQEVIVQVSKRLIFYGAIAGMVHVKKVVTTEFRKARTLFSNQVRPGSKTFFLFNLITCS